MRVLIAGAGALGSLLGGYFSVAGAEVTLLARKAHVEAIRARGLTIDGGRGLHIIQNLEAITDPADMKAADILVVCVKSQDTPKMLLSLRHLRGKVGAALSFQNGARKDEELAEAFGTDAVIGAATMIGAALPEWGRVLHTGDGSTWIGEFDGGSSARVEAVFQLFRKVDLPIEIRRDIRTAIWCKLNQMIPAATLSCLTRLCMHQMYLDRTLAGLFVELSREVARVAEALHIPLADFHGLAVKTVCTIPFEDAVESVMARGRSMCEHGITAAKISTLQDLERGKRTEAAETIGYVVHAGKDLGVELPKLTLLYDVIRGLEAAQQDANLPT